MLEKYFYGIKNNIWKFFVFSLTWRRNFLPIVWIYYLTFPNTTIIELALMWTIAFSMNFILEMPSWYISDVVWHKKTLILNKIFFVLSTACFTFWEWFWWFLVWTVAIQIWFAFYSWTETAFFHETLEEMWEEDKFAEYRSKISWWVSLISAFCIVWLPFLIDFSFKLPFLIRLFVDIIWLLVTISFVTPKTEYHQQENKKLWVVIRELKWKRELLSVLFFAIIARWIFWSDWPFRYIYLEDLWFVVRFIWLVMWWSRLVWFIFSRFVHKLEKINFKYVLIWLLLTLSCWLILSSILQNPYIVWLFMAIVNWIFRWIRPIIQKYIINHIPDKKYKATVLSIEWQLKSLLQVITIFGIWFVMDYSFRLWYLVLWLLMLVLLWTLLLFTHKYIQKK